MADRPIGLAIGVDELIRYEFQDWRRGQWCHMLCNDFTPEGLECLHEFAEALGLRRGWFQPHPLHPHYDLRPSLRTKARLAGAVNLTQRESMAFIYRGRAMRRGLDISNLSPGAKYFGTGVAYFAPVV